MSHEATNWAIRQRGLKPAAKIVLWHLADCHNRHTGQCNPYQSTLADMCEMSRASLNNHLNHLEAKGLIQRVQTVDDGTKRQRPTQYILAFDAPPKPVSENETRTQDVVGAVSKIWTPPVSRNEPTPVQIPDTTRVQNLDTIENLGKEEPWKNQPPQPPRGRGGGAKSRFGVSEEVKRLVMQGKTY